MFSFTEAVFFRRLACATNFERLHREVRQNPMPEHHQALGGNGQLAPSALLIQDRVQKGRVGGVEDGPVPTVGCGARAACFP